MFGGQNDRSLRSRDKKVTFSAVYAVHEVTYKLMYSELPEESSELNVHTTLTQFIGLFAVFIVLS